MNKGKPSGFKADTKKDAGAKSTSRPRRGQAGAGPEYTDRETNASNGLSNASILSALNERDGAVAAINRFPEIRNESSTNGNGQRRVIRFEFAAGKAEKVCIAGTFNDWHPHASEMIAVGDGRWQKDLSLSPGEYEYRFVIDGRWVIDPGCPVQKSNGFGESNSVICVPEL
ncbi:MAG TPA: glycogen-binding domain-containing protein [Verrucomicrobiae bacterium]|jgi:hypothetical protein